MCPPITRAHRAGETEEKLTQRNALHKPRLAHAHPHPPILEIRIARDPLHADRKRLEQHQAERALYEVRDGIEGGGEEVGRGEGEGEEEGETARGVSELERGEGVEGAYVA